MGELTSQLRALSPQRTLERGYAIAQLPGGRVSEHHRRRADAGGRAKSDHRLDESSAVNHGHSLSQLRTRSRVFEVN